MTPTYRNVDAIARRLGPGKTYRVKSGAWLAKAAGARRRITRTVRRGRAFLSFEHRGVRFECEVLKGS